ncbi:MmpS family transport accessory protein [Rhodococcus sp. T7]|uniref:MmpS family transport accessory protein n=1 Tax=Rhodococcus sp. T7 TaxID=627444 RepID=UPI001359C742|nr:MmpS family transport accessory protein [Rhodococcus sp. T7]KAF0957730.1 hypothetical protein MLGJGCBP_09562 [Rhodococcus sp. T7]KAF0965437.1 hypothetical protein MLGJGCBP_01404 [Rhodococcus sp. T7]
MSRVRISSRSGHRTAVRAHRRTTPGGGRWGLSSSAWSSLRQEYPASAPWSLSVVNAATYPMMGLGAQTEGQSVTCRIIVDGRVMDEQTPVGQYAVVNCNA